MHAAHSSNASEFVTRRCMRMLQDVQVGQSIKSLEIVLCQCLNCLFIIYFSLSFLCTYCHSAQFGLEEHQQMEGIPFSGRYFAYFASLVYLVIDKFFFSLPASG